MSYGFVSSCEASAAERHLAIPGVLPNRTGLDMVDRICLVLLNRAFLVFYNLWGGRIHRAELGLGVPGKGARRGWFFMKETACHDR